MRHFDELGPEWLQWVNTNLERGVCAEHIAVELNKHGWTTAAHAVVNLGLSNTPQLPRPTINTSTNQIGLTDREVHLALNLKSPQIVVIDDFLSDEECGLLIDDSQDKFYPSEVLNHGTGMSEVSTLRTSHNASYRGIETTITNVIENRVEELLSWPKSSSEGLLVLRYENGQEYVPHHDYFDPQNPSYNDIISNGGQRVGTFLIFLSDVEAGGTTNFPTIGLEVHPKKGRAIYFSNQTPNGICDDKTLHAGTPVITGVKYLATFWLRESTFAR